MSRTNGWTSRDRIAAALAHHEADRVALSDAPWATTVERWRREGLPADVSPSEYFGYELAGFGADTSARFPTEVVEDTEQYRIERNANGALIRNWKHQTSTPEMIDFAIKTSDDWERHRDRFSMSPDRISLDTLEHNRGCREEGYWIHFPGIVGYDKAQGLVGSETLLMAIAAEPDWVADMFMTSVDLVIQTAEAMMDAGYVYDGAFLCDDMGYRNGPLFSPDAYRRLSKPAHAKVIDFFHSKGLPVIMHSCGRVDEFLPDLIDAGLDCLQPLETKAGMDLVKLKEQHGDKLAFMGGIDVRKMADPDPGVIEEEVRTKVLCAKEGGGYIYHSDHSVPDNVSFPQYCRVIELVKEYGTYS